MRRKNSLPSLRSRLGRLPVFTLRFAVGFVLSCGKMFGGLSPFGVSYAAALAVTRSAPAAALGAALGYAAANGLETCIKYIVSMLLILTAVKTFSKLRPGLREWVCPVCAFAITATVSSAFELIGSHGVDSFLLCFSDSALCAAGAYFFKKAILNFSSRLDFSRSTDILHTVSVIMFLAAMILPLCAVKIFGMISLGRIAAVMCVIVFAYKGGVASGAAVGICLGAAMDCACGLFWFTGAYGIIGLTAGVLSKQGKAIFILSAVLSDAVLAIACMDMPIVPACLYEMFIVSMLFIIIPNSFLNKLEAYLPSPVSSFGQMRSRQYITARLKKASEAFEMLFKTVRTASGTSKNESDIAAIFDRTAEKICRSCRLSSVCWISDYQTTLNALNSVSSLMLYKGKLDISDLPDYFRQSCCDAQGFIDSLNDELRGFAYRKQYRARLLNSQKAAFGQYEDIAGILSDFSSQLEKESVCESVLESKLKKYLISLGISGDVAVYRCGKGRLRAEISKDAASKLKRRKSYLTDLSSLLGEALIEADANGEFEVFSTAEPYIASVGTASIGRKHSSVSGDSGAYFKTDSGILHVILSDGMGTGMEAEKYSKRSVSILKSFLRAGVAAGSAVRILNDLLLLKNQDDTDCCTIDLISIDLFSGKTEMYKYGAAASYVKSGEKVNRIAGRSLACGLGFPPEDSPDRFNVTLLPGSFAVLVSDGVTSDGQDIWLFELLKKYGGADPKELARTVVKTAAERYGTDDDMMALVIYVDERK